MDQLLPLSVVLPLLAAAAIGALNPLLRRQRRILDSVAIAASAVVTGLLVVIMIRVVHHDETYWFAGFRPHHGIAIGIDFEVGPLSAGLACLAAVLVTAGMIFSWRYFERVATYYHVLMLAFLVGIALLTPLGLAGTAVYVAGHAMVTAALFLCTGIVLHRLRSVNETWLHGRGRRLPVTGVIFTLAALGLADLPPFATYLGQGWITGSSSARGMTWVTAALVFASVLAGAAVLRVAGGVFYGLGDPPSETMEMAEQSSEETSETDEDRQRTPPSMIAPPAVLVAAAAATGLLPRLGPVVEAAAVRFQDQRAYNATVLHSAQIAHVTAPYAAAPARATVSGVVTGLGTAAGAVFLAFLGLYWRRLPLLRRGFEPGTGLVRPLERFQSGVVNDYVTWIVIGVACLGGALAFSFR